MKTRALPVVVLLACSVVLAGCATAAPDTSPVSQTPDPTPSSDSEEPPAAVQDPADPSTWIIAYDGMGPIEFGATVAVPSGTPYAGDLDPADCPGVLTMVADGYPTVLVNHRNGSTVASYGLTTLADPASLASTTPRTAEGIGVGSPVADVTAAYPDAQVSDGSPGVTYYSITDGTTWIDFTVTFETVRDVHVMNGPTPPHENCG